MFTENCPDHNLSLSGWNPGHQPEKAVVVRRGHLFRLDSSATFYSLTIQSGGKQLKVDDSLSSNLKSITLMYINLLDMISDMHIKFNLLISGCNIQQARTHVSLPLTSHRSGSFCRQC